jgi:hypothetical protein
MADSRYRDRHVQLLVDDIVDDKYPSVEMMARLQRLVSHLPPARQPSEQDEESDQDGDRG